MAVEYDGITVHFYRDLERLRASWLEISPGDGDIITEFCADIKKLHGFSLPVGKPMDMMSILEKVRYMLSMKDVGLVMAKYGKMTVPELGEKFKHPALRTAIASFLPEGNYSASSVIFPLGTFTGGQSSIPLGGSKTLSMRMTEKYLSLGGQVETSSEAVDLEIDRGRLIRVICRDGKSFQADYFIAACDAKVLYDQLLEGKYPDPEFEKRYNNPTDYPLASNVYVGVGCEGTMSDIPRTLKFPVKLDHITQNRKPVEYLQMTHYPYEPDFAPEGHTLITLAINQFEPELAEWESLVKDKQAYRQKKADIGKSVLQAMEARFPYMAGKLKLLDVASPQTYKRYCNAYRGAFMGFWPTVKGKQLNHTAHIKGLANIFLSGQWLQPPGGLPVALITGRDTIIRLCKEEKRPFVGV